MRPLRETLQMGRIDDALGGEDLFVFCRRSRTAQTTTILRRTSDYANALSGDSATNGQKIQTLADAGRVDPAADRTNAARSQ